VPASLATCSTARTTAYRYIPRSLPPPPAEWDTFVSATVNVGYQFR
jgi:hypothetical protein